MGKVAHRLLLGKYVDKLIFDEFDILWTFFWTFAPNISGRKIDIGSLDILRLSIVVEYLVKNTY